ncbi:Uncharacterized protein dnl_31130 [Desulfonema limicola]|uniref:Uncharacterized protein n=1 Tax=Desulfonema limicola TaxID=45656 RepID=A0A975B8M9_9BACT|nr:hypothetical protein [Desulfonema limicola]QTA80800.1 Uncharacterized protein dnl_31130 [Desulfonema limicola]
MRPTCNRKEIFDFNNQILDDLKNFLMLFNSPEAWYSTIMSKNEDGDVFNVTEANTKES